MGIGAYFWQAPPFGPWWCRAAFSKHMQAAATAGLPQGQLAQTQTGHLATLTGMQVGLEFASYSSSIAV